MRLNYAVELPTTKRFRLCKNQVLIDEFVKSEKPYAKVECDIEEYTSTSSMTNSLKQTIKRMGLDKTVSVKSINGNAFIFNMPLNEKEGVIL